MLGKNNAQSICIVTQANIFAIFCCNVRSTGTLATLRRHAECISHMLNVYKAPNNRATLVLVRSLLKNHRHNPAVPTRFPPLSYKTQYILVSQNFYTEKLLHTASFYTEKLKDTSSYTEPFLHMTALEITAPKPELDAQAENSMILKAL